MQRFCRSVEAVNGLLGPRGPQPAAVYWRRRAGVAGVFIVVLALGGNAVRGSKPQPQPSDADLVVLAPAGTPTSLPTEAPPTAAAEPTVDAQGNRLCGSKDVKVTVEVDRKTTQIGIGVHIRMAVKNVSDSECMRDVGSGANEVVITNGGDTTWSSDYCNPSDASDAVKLPVGGTWSVKVVWNGKVTDNGCTIKGDAPLGKYAVTARNGKLTSSRATFTVS
jgi:hypothetical protein